MADLKNLEPKLRSAYQRALQRAYLRGVEDGRRAMRRRLRRSVRESAQDAMIAGPFVCFVWCSSHQRLEPLEAQKRIPSGCDSEGIDSCSSAKGGPSTS